jgi:UPF0755 protein
MRKLVLGCSIVVLLVSAAVFFDVARILYRPMLEKTADTPIIVTLEKNSTAISFVHDLQRQGLIHSPRLLLWMLRLQGASHHLKAGIYDIRPGETAWQLFHRVVSGDVYVLPFRITEGTTLQTVTNQMQQLLYLVQQPDDWQKITDGYHSAEGLLLADTYFYDAGSQRTALLMRARESLLRVLNAAFENRAPHLPYRTPYELLTAASIIEKEASKSDEKRLISGVIVNRLRKRMPLQMDPTVIYALGSQFSGRLTHQDLAIDSPYNTYQHYGLPPTPIAMVGRDAIDAAAHPRKTNYLYYVANDNGGHHFSETYEEQRKAIMMYHH